jgi:membrane-associated phospholipid phosphatase
MSQVEQVMKLQKWGEGIRYPVLRIGLNIASKVLSAFADRVGAYSLLPLVLAWSDSANTIAFVWLWFACVYVGHLLKDSLQIPRPPVPPVTVKESAFSKEFGFPSCHAMISSAFVYASMCSFRSADSVPSSFFHLEWINMLFMLIVVSCVGLSRVFLGVHFPMDVYGGICLGTVATFVYRPVLVFYMTHAPEADFAYASLVVTGVMLSLIVLYRAVPVVYTSAYITVAEVGGVTLAFTLGVMADDMLISGESFQFSGDDKLMTLYFQSVVFCLGCVAVVRPAVVSRLQSFIVRHTGKPYVKASV